MIGIAARWLGAPWLPPAPWGAGRVADVPILLLLWCPGAAFRIKVLSFLLSVEEACAVFQPALVLH